MSDFCGRIASFSILILGRRILRLRWGQCTRTLVHFEEIMAAFYEYPP